MLEFCDATFSFVAAHLLIQRVQELLAGGGTGERRAVVERSAKATEIEQAFSSAIERHSHAVQQINDAGGGFAHRFYRRLIGKKVTAVNGVVEMLPGSIAFTFEVFCGIDPALSTD